MRTAWEMSGDWVDGRGWRPIHLFATVFFILGVPIALLYGTQFGWMSGRTIEGLGYYALGAGLTLVFFWFFSVRGVRVDGDAVTFRFPGNTVRVAWANLAPPRTPGLLGEVAFVVTSPSRWTSGGYRVTAEQARAILTHPARPVWPIPGWLATTTGLPWGGPGREG